MAIPKTMVIDRLKYKEVTCRSCKWFSPEGRHDNVTNGKCIYLSISGVSEHFGCTGHDRDKTPVEAIQDSLSVIQSKPFEATKAEHLVQMLKQEGFSVVKEK